MISWPAPLVIAHRGASGYRPEHTLAAYALAARMGADCIEPDLVATKDEVLVARHENEISGTTDVADRTEFATLHTTKTMDGREVEGWFVEDFTWEQLRTLRARERLPDLRPENTASDGVWGIASFASILALRANLSAELGREIMVYPELKHPRHLRTLGLAVEELIVADLSSANLMGAGHAGAERPGSEQPVMVQCFEHQTLIRLRELGMRAPLLQLMPADHAWSPDQLARWSAVATGIGPDKRSVIAWTDDDRLGQSTGLVQAAHAAGLFVHPYTFRAENVFLPVDLRDGDTASGCGDLAGEITAYLDAGVDGFFTDQADAGVSARNAWIKTEGRLQRRTGTPQTWMSALKGAPPGTGRPKAPRPTGDGDREGLRRLRRPSQTCRP
ncbi:MAG: glycerophosphodiester phosphodiesterase family protein [Ornithinimicrobium sp.]